MSTTPPVRGALRFRLPAELSGGVPRDVRLTGRGITLAAIAAALVAGAMASAVLMSVAVARTSEERRLRERDGVPAEAEVVLVTPRRGDNPRRLEYRYWVDGREHTGRARLRNRDLRPLSQGTLMPVDYLRSRPETSWMRGYEPDDIPIGVIPITSMSLLAGAAGVTWKLRRQWILLAEGRVAEARITGQKKVRARVGNEAVQKSRYRVTYEFRALSGATLTGRINVEKAPPSVGTTVAVVYHRDKPEWSAVYPLQLVRPARIARDPK